MYGIVSLLDNEHHEQIEALWVKFRERFGVYGVHQTPVPHFSYHVAEQYDTSRTRAILEPIAQQTAPFTVRTHGLGIFTNPIEPTLYIPLRPDEALYTLHRRLWEPLNAIATEASPLYAPNTWVPHITLAEGDMDHDELAQLVRFLSARDFFWEIKVESIGLLGSAEGEMDELQSRIPLTGGQ